MTKKIIFSIIFVCILCIIFSNKPKNNLKDVSINELIKENVKNIKDEDEKNKEMVKIALESYKMLNEKEPKDLNELVPDYIDNVPLNKKTNKPFNIKDFAEIKKTSVKKDEFKPKEILKNEDGSSIVQTKPFKFVSMDKDNPFSIKKDNNETPKGRIDLNGLENFKLTAIVSIDKEKKAMMEDENGKGFIIKVGSRVGKNSIVSNITDKSIIVKEITYNFKNEKNEVIKEISLRN